MCIRIPRGTGPDDCCPYIAREYDEEMFCLVEQGFEAPLIAQFAWHGFFPMASRWSGKVVMLAKIHQKRCVLRLGELHISKKVRSRAKRFTLTVDRSWDAVFRGLDRFHVEHNGTCWLYPQLRDALRELHRPVAPPPLLEIEISAAAPPAAPGREAIMAKLRAAQAKAASPLRGARFHTVELWDDGGGGGGGAGGAGGERVLVAADVGIAIGACYTSMSGFSDRAYPSAGAVQIAALAALLRARGFEVIDFGMSMAYKLELGATELPRGEWLALQAKLRNADVTLEASTAGTAAAAATDAAAAAAIHVAGARGGGGGGGGGGAAAAGADAAGEGEGGLHASALIQWMREQQQSVST